MLLLVHFCVLVVCVTNQALTVTANNRELEKSQFFVIIRHKLNFLDVIR